MNPLYTIVPAAAILALLTGCSAAKSQPTVVIYGNANGLWSLANPNVVGVKPAALRIPAYQPSRIPLVEIQPPTSPTVFND